MRAAEWVFGVVPALRPVDVQVPRFEIHLVPPQRHEFGRAQPVAKHQQNDRRIAHGMLTLSISTGLMTRMNLVTDTVVAFYGIDKLRFVKPVFIGDTIHVRKKVSDTMAKGGTAGVVTFDTSVLNQNGEAVLVYRDKLVIKKRG